MENLQILPESEYKEVEGRNYINPNLPIDRTNRFIDNLRANQQANTAEIAQQTEALGTTVPSSEGGLMGAGSYFSSRYATPQRSSVAQNLRTAAQATALNEALANEQAMWKQRYNQAYRDYQMRQYRKSEQDRNRMYNSGNTGGGPTASPLGVDTNESGETTIDIDEYNPSAGEIIPNTDYVSDYQDANTGQWYTLTSPRELDVIAAGNTLAGMHPTDGTTVTVNGKTLRYVGSTDQWYEQTSSAGPDTYSPRYW